MCKGKDIWYFEYTPYSYPNNRICITFNRNKSETWIILEFDGRGIA